MENNNIKITCSLCGDQKISFFTNKKGFDLYKCQKCKLLFIFPVPKSVEVYDKSYFSGAEKGYGYVDYDVDKGAMIPTFNKYFDLFSSLGLNRGKLLDIGAATGFFMEIAISRGYEAKGVEISDFAAEKGRIKGLDIVTGELQNQNFPDESYDIVTMFDVIEHVPDPKSVLLEARRILKKNGLLVINTPDAESFWAKVLGKNWQLIMPPEHINYFSSNNLGEYLTANGFKIKIDKKIGKKFTLQYIFKMLYKWIGFRIFLTNIFSKSFLSKVYIPINLRDNFFMIVEKK